MRSEFIAKPARFRPGADLGVELYAWTQMWGKSKDRLFGHDLSRKLKLNSAVFLHFHDFLGRTVRPEGKLLKIDLGYVLKTTF